MSIITTDGKWVPSQESFVIDEFLIRHSVNPLIALDIETCIILLKLEFAEKIYKAGIMDGNSLVGKIFSDNDNVNWAKLETSWANILRNTKRNISRLLDRKEDLLRKDTRDITSNDEREYEKLDEQILGEIQEAKEKIEEVTQQALNIVK